MSSTSQLLRQSRLPACGTHARNLPQKSDKQPSIPLKNRCEIPNIIYIILVNLHPNYSAILDHSVNFRHINLNINILHPNTPQFKALRIGQTDISGHILGKFRNLPHKISNIDIIQLGKARGMPDFGPHRRHTC